MGNHQPIHLILISSHNPPTKQLRRRKTEKYDVMLSHITIQLKTSLKKYSIQIRKIGYKYKDNLRRSSGYKCYEIY